MKKFIFLFSFPMIAISAGESYAYYDSNVVAKVILSQVKFNPQKVGPPAPKGSPLRKKLGMPTLQQPQPGERPSTTERWTPPEKPKKPKTPRAPAVASIAVPKSAGSDEPPPKMLQGGEEMFSAIKMLENEIKRDTVITEGELTKKVLKTVRERFAYDLEYKRQVIAALEKKGRGNVPAAVELIQKTVVMEMNISSSKSSSGSKRRKMQRRIEANIPVKEKALSILKKEVGER